MTRIVKCNDAKLLPLCLMSEIEWFEEEEEEKKVLTSADQLLLLVMKYVVELDSSPFAVSM